jgi:CBS domain-containing membrane protein
MNLSPEPPTAEKTICDIMSTDLVTLKLNDTLRLADDLMLLGKLRHFPVMDNDKVVGLLNHSDLLQASMHSLAQHRKDSIREALGAVVVRDVMKPAATIAAGTSLKETARIMVEREVDCVLVVDGDKLVGLTTRTDLLREMAKA